MHRGWLLAVLLAGQFIANVDSAIANVAAPSIRTGLRASDGQVALVVSGYLIAYAVLLVTGARLGSTYGHRRVFLTGLATFTAASVCCGFAPGIGWLIAARFVQGAGAALMVPQVLSGIQLHFGGVHRVRALGYYSIALSGGAVAGQVLGGLTISADLFGTTWRPIFLANLPLGVLVFLLARAVLPVDRQRDPRGMDLAGVAALSAVLLLVVAPLLLGRDEGWPIWTWLCLGASPVALGWLIRTERRVAAAGGRPLLGAAVLRRPAVRAGLIAHGLTTATYFSLLFILALYLQQGLDLSPAYSGLAMVSWVAAFGLAGPLLPRLPARALPHSPTAGCLILAVGYAAVMAFLLAGGHAGPVLFALLGVGGLGLGVSANSLIGAMTSAVTTDSAADLSGVINTNAQCAGAVGVAVASTAYLGLQSGWQLAPGSAFAVLLTAFTAAALTAAVIARAPARPNAGAADADQ